MVALNALATYAATVGQNVDLTLEARQSPSAHVAVSRESFLWVKSWTN